MYVIHSFVSVRVFQPRSGLFLGDPFSVSISKLFDITHGHLILRILIIHFNWNVSRMLLSFTFQVSHSHNNPDGTSVVNNLNIILDVYMCS